MSLCLIKYHVINGGTGGIAPHILHPGTTLRLVTSFMLGPFYPGLRESPVHIN